MADITRSSRLLELRIDFDEAGSVLARVRSDLIQIRDGDQVLQQQVVAVPVDEAQFAAIVGSQFAAVASQAETLQHQLQATQAALGEAQALAERLTRERDDAVVQCEEAQTKQALVEEERASIIADRDAAFAARDAAVQERDGMLSSLEALTAERDVLQAALDAINNAEPEPTSLPAYAASVRYTKETGGATWNDWPIHTDATSQTKYLAELQAIALGVRIDGDGWKFADGVFRSVSNADFPALATAARAHVRACFVAEAEVLAGIAAGTITTREQVYTAFAAI
jgi:hypothetical protein